MYPTHHRQITRTALIYWQRESGVALPDGLCHAIVRGSGIEDAPSWQRLYHWHFYRSNPQIPDWPLLRLTSEYRVRALQQHLSHTQPHVERGEWIGRLLHHLQDMSTPAMSFRFTMIRSSLMAMKNGCLISCPRIGLVHNPR